MNPTPEKPHRSSLRCMEIRGGNRAIEEAFETPGLEAWLFSSPFDGSDRGGDLHYVSLCGGGVITRLVVADVSGHGASAAEFSDVLRALMHKNINTKSQTRLVKALNRQFGETTQLLRFATAVVATYLATRQTLTLCNSGHPRPLWHQASAGRWTFLDHEGAEAENLPLGLADESAYDQFTVTLGRGDLILIYSDALIEAADPSGRMIGESGLLDLARGLDASKPDCVASSILEAVCRQRVGRPADDDVTLLTLFHKGGGPRRLSLADKLDVYAKVFGLRDY
jgi:phosphoserine phosphatase RsbU/P